MRRNLVLKVAVAHTKDQALSIAAMCISEAPRDSCALLYCRRKVDCDRICFAFRLCLPSRTTAVYHANVAPEGRRQILHDVQCGKCIVVVCTVAFGLGVDIGHIHCVVHLQEPESVAQYMQEVGRAGRQGQKAECTLIPGFNTVDNLFQRLAFRDSTSVKSYEQACCMEYYCNMVTVCRHVWLLRALGYNIGENDGSCETSCDLCLSRKCEMCGPGRV